MRLGRADSRFKSECTDWRSREATMSRIGERWWSLAKFSLLVAGPTPKVLKWKQRALSGETASARQVLK